MATTVETGVAIESASSKPSAKYAWGILILLLLGWMIAFLDRTSIAAALADKNFIAEFGLTSVERGWLASTFFWAYALVQLPMGYVVDRYGIKWPYAICFSVWCVAAALISQAHVLTHLVLLRMLIGVAEAVVIPASYRYIANAFDESRKGMATGVFSLGGKLGPALGISLAAYLIHVSSWSMMFLATGLIGMLWLVPWLLFYKNDFPTKEQAKAMKRRASTVPLRNLLVSPVVWGGLIMTFCSSYFMFYCATWMPAYLVEQRGLSLSKSGMLTFISFISVAIVAISAAWVADRFIRRGYDVLKVRKTFVVMGCLGGMTILCGAYAESQTAALFWNVASLSLAGLGTANNLTLSKMTLTPKQAVGLNTGLLTIATSLAGGVSASLAGWLLHISGSYTWPMMSVAICMATSAVACVVLMRREWAPKVNEIKAE